jgi:hypothetical protein
VGALPQDEFVASEVGFDLSPAALENDFPLSIKQFTSRIWLRFAKIKIQSASN